MTLRTLWWILFGVTLAGLTYQVNSAWRRRSRGEPTPSYVAGNIPGWFGMLCIVAAHLAGVDTVPAYVLLAASFIFLAWDAILFSRAKRAEKERYT